MAEQIRRPNILGQVAYVWLLALAVVLPPALYNANSGSEFTITAALLAGALLWGPGPPRPGRSLRGIALAGALMGLVNLAVGWWVASTTPKEVPLGDEAYGSLNPPAPSPLDAAAVPLDAPAVLVDRHPAVLAGILVTFAAFPLAAYLGAILRRDRRAATGVLVCLPLAWCSTTS